MSYGAREALKMAVCAALWGGSVTTIGNYRHVTPWMTTLICLLGGMVIGYALAVARRKNVRKRE